MDTIPLILFLPLYLFIKRIDQSSHLRIPDGYSDHNTSQQVKCETNSICRTK